MSLKKRVKDREKNLNLYLNHKKESLKIMNLQPRKISYYGKKMKKRALFFFN